MLLQLQYILETNTFPKMVSVAVVGAYQADVFWDLFCVSNLGTHIIVVKGGVAILGRVSPSEVIWRGSKCHR